MTILQDSKPMELKFVPGGKMLGDGINLFNQVNFANPISNLNAVTSSGGSLDPNTGRIINPGDFGKIISTSNNPRIVQFALKLNF